MTDGQHVNGVPQGFDDHSILNELRRRMDDFVARAALEIPNEEIEERLRCITTGADSKSHGGERVGPADNSRGSASRRRGVGVPLIQSQKVGRLIDGVVDDLGSLVAPGAELRTMGGDGRREIRAVVTEWRKQLRGCPAGAFGVEGTAMVLGTVAALAEALVADRDERAALNLVGDAWPHLRFLGCDHPAVFEVRRVHAQALTEIGQYEDAEARLRRLSQDERRVLRAADGRTKLLLNWALTVQDRVSEAKAGFEALTSSLTELPGPGTLLEHTGCRRAWALLLQGRLEDSVRAYDGIIAMREGTLGEYHPDTLDARHSQGKGLVLAGQGERAFALLNSLLEIRTRVQGNRHPDTLQTLQHRHIALVQIDPRDDRVVAQTLGDLAEIQRIYYQRYGPAHPMSCDTSAWIDRLDKVQGANRFRDSLPDLRQITTTDRDPDRERSAAVTAAAADRLPSWHRPSLFKTAQRPVGASDHQMTRQPDHCQPDRRPDRTHAP